MDSHAELLPARLRALPPREGRAVLIEYIGSIVQEIVGVSSKDPPRAGQTILDLGLSSLRLIELKDRLEQVFSVEVPVVLFFEQVTVDSLASHLLSKLAGSTPNGRDGFSTPIADDAGPDEDLLPMSDEEAEARLQRLIEELSRRSEP